MNKSILMFLVLVAVSAGAAWAVVSGDGRKTVTTAGVPEALSTSDAPFLELTICAENDNTGVIVVGYSPIASLSTREGIPLNAEDCYTLASEKGILSEIQIDSTVSGDGVTYAYKYR